MPAIGERVLWFAIAEKCPLENITEQGFLDKLWLYMHTDFYAGKLKIEKLYLRWTILLAHAAGIDEDTYEAAKTNPPDKPEKIAGTPHYTRKQLRTWLDKTKTKFLAHPDASKIYKSTSSRTPLASTSSAMSEQPSTSCSIRSPQQQGKRPHLGPQQLHQQQAAKRPRLDPDVILPQVLAMTLVELPGGEIEFAGPNEDVVAWNKTWTAADFVKHQGDLDYTLRIVNNPDAVERAIKQANKDAIRESKFHPIICLAKFH